MGETLRDLILKWYKLLAPDAYREQPLIFDTLSTMVVDHVMGVYYIRPPNYILPATWFVAIIGPQGKGKSSIMDATEDLYVMAGLKKATEGSPEGVIEGIQDKVDEMGFAKLYLFWDEAGRIQADQKSYLKTLEFWVNKMYHSRALDHKTRTRGSIAVERDTYMINIVFGAIHTQWAEIEQQFNKGFGRRTLPIYLNPDIPYIADIDFKSLFLRAMVEPRLEWALKRCFELSVIIGIDKASRWNKVIKELALPETKKMAISEYVFKYAIGRFLGESIEVPEWEEIEKGNAEEWMIEQFKHNIENWATEYYIREKSSNLIFEKDSKIEPKNEHPNIPIIPKDSDVLGENGEIKITAKQLFSLYPNVPYTTYNISILLWDDWDDDDIWDDWDDWDKKKEGESITSMPRNVHPNHPIRALGCLGFEKSGSNSNLLPYLSPHSIRVALDVLTKVIASLAVSPSEELTELQYRIEDYLKNGGKPVLSYSKFIREIFHTNNVGTYDKLIELAEQAKIIRIIPSPYMRWGKPIRYVVVDFNARVCGNCRYFHDGQKCPRLKSVINVRDYWRHVKPWDEACDKFEAIQIEEEMEGSGK